MSVVQHLETVLNLIAETGDRCIVIHERYDPFVVMSLHEYRALLKAAVSKAAPESERALLDKINQDIRAFRRAQADHMAEYDLEQFRIETRHRRATHKRAPSKESPARTPAMNLPVVAHDEAHEFHLEPLA